MRRAAIVSFLACLALVACAAPDFRLDPRFSVGEVRDYALVADATVLISGGSQSTTQHTSLVASTRLEVIDITNGITSLALTITPDSLTQDGKKAPPPAPQKILVTVSAEGRVLHVTTSGAQPVGLEAADVEDLVPLIGPPLPPHRVHLADRWTASSAPTPAATPGATASPTSRGTEDARFASLRVVGGYDCAIVAISTRRPVVRERVIGGSPLRLAGIEFSSGEIAFAFRQGFPVTLRSSSEARLAISSVGGQNGSVVIDTTTSLTLRRRTLPGSR